MAGAPFSLMTEVKVTEPRRDRQMAIVGALAPGRRVGLEMVERIVDLRLLPVHPALHPLVLGAEPLLVDEQQRGIEEPVAERAQRQRVESLGTGGRKEPGRRRQAVEVLADDMAVEELRS